jgi:hypothetical protein
VRLRLQRQAIDTLNDALSATNDAPEDPSAQQPSADVAVSAAVKPR